ncbi:MAG: hypothetical protein WBB85_11030 [Albidovulum sp.]|uniref:hypothetical protein n=1 Tax=Albidovulum sp. TaxID=1872424 RepID=UPI003CC2B333
MPGLNSSGGFGTASLAAGRDPGAAESQHRVQVAPQEHLSIPTSTTEQTERDRTQLTRGVEPPERGRDSERNRARKEARLSGLLRLVENDLDEGDVERVVAGSGRRGEGSGAEDEVSSGTVESIKADGSLRKIRPKIVTPGEVVDIGDGQTAVLNKGKKSKTVEKANGEKVLLLDESLSDREMEGELRKAAKQTIQSAYYTTLYTLAGHYGEYLSLSRAMIDLDQYRPVGPAGDVQKD